MVHYENTVNMLTPFLYTFAVVIDAFNSPALAAGLLIAGAAFIFLKSKGHATAMVVSAVCAYAVNSILKMLFAVPRLDSALVPVTGYRFPSQHAVMAGAFFGSVCLSALCVLRSPYKKALVVFVSLSAISIVAWSRVFLYAHLPVDVIVGSVIGMSISYVVHYFTLRNCYCAG